MNVAPFASTVDRIPPSNLEAEMALLGAILVDRGLFESVTAIVQPSHFYASLHESIYLALYALYEQREPLDKVALAEELRNRGMLDKIGGMAYLNSLMDTVPTAASAQYYAKIVREKAALRALIHVGAKISQLGYESEEDVPAAINRSERLVRELGERYDGGALRPYTMREVGAERARRALERPTFYNSTPWPSLTRRVRFGPGLHGWSAAVKMGKTHAALMNALWDALHHGVVLYFAAEGGRENMHELLVEMLSGVRVEMLGGLVTLAGLARRRVLAAEELLARSFPNLWLYGSGDELISSAQVVVEAKRQAQRLEAKGGRLASVWIDVAADLADVREADSRRDERITHDRKKNAFRRLRDAGISLRTPFHVVDHQTTKVGDNRPSRTTIRDGGDLGAIAENIILVWRPDREKNERDGLFIVDASRRGHEGSVDMRYERGLWLDQETSPPQTRSFLETMVDEALGEPEQPPHDPGLTEYALAMLPPAEPARRTMTVDVNGEPAVFVPRTGGEYDTDREQLDAVWGQP
ncbi:MAG: replicative helicase [Candidatus Eremiobacteraeota bacterium]|nr:replicative helicase [Candidatus Eremiobacteraeota bacterium]